MDMTVVQRVARGMDKIRKVLNSTNNNHNIHNNAGTKTFWSFWSLNNSYANNDNKSQNINNAGKANFWRVLFGEDDDDTPSFDPDLFRLLSEEDEGRESETGRDDGVGGGVRFEDDSVDDDDDDDDSESGNESEDEEAESAPVGRVSKGAGSRSTSSRHHPLPSSRHHPLPSPPLVIILSPPLVSSPLPSSRHHRVPSSRQHPLTSPSLVIILSPPLLSSSSPPIRRNPLLSHSMQILLNLYRIPSYSSDQRPSLTRVACFLFPGPFTLTRCLI